MVLLNFLIFSCLTVSSLGFHQIIRPSHHPQQQPSSSARRRQHHHDHHHSHQQQRGLFVLVVPASSSTVLGVGFNHPRSYILAVNAFGIWKPTRDTTVPFSIRSTIRQRDDERWNSWALSSSLLAATRSDDEDGPIIKDEEPSSPIEIELEKLQERLQLIEALEARNEAQLESFVDEHDQWESLEAEEQELLKTKDEIESRMELLAEQLVQLWMSQKSMEG